MSLLLDTIVVSELRKAERADARLLDWFHDVADEEIHLSVLVTRNVKDVAWTGVSYLNPFRPAR